MPEHQNTTGCCQRSSAGGRSTRRGDLGGRRDAARGEHGGRGDALWRARQRHGSCFHRSTMDLGLKGQVAIVTGGSEGIGRATALRLAEEGARVAIAARRPDVLASAEREIRDRGGEVLAIVADVTKPADVERCINNLAMHRRGRVHSIASGAPGVSFSGGATALAGGGAGARGNGPEAALGAADGCAVCARGARGGRGRG
ncbi:SDR family NAD(P)-dependent oxidoreductase [Sorangium sp. So ce1151]|uniref:SDR family NAD(P)-dependent oxidoreductase n=1 Tax=Sorangium sp. So ce1151 TaxID=3133332 RepID=UPI003F62CA61